MARNLRTVAQFSKESGVFSEAALRWHIFRAADNGLQAAGAVVKIGRRVYIDADRFEAWVDAHRLGSEQAAA